MFAIILASQNFCFSKKRAFWKSHPRPLAQTAESFSRKLLAIPFFRTRMLFILNNALPGCPAVLIHHFFRIHFCIRISSEKSKKHCRKENNRKHCSGSKMSLREQHSKLIDN